MQTLSRFALLAALALPLPAFAGKLEKADKLAQQAYASAEAGDMAGAAKQATKALQANPDHLGALLVRGTVFWQLWTQLPEGDPQKDFAWAVASADLGRMIELDPNSTASATARQMLGLGGVDTGLPTIGLREPSAECPQSAVDIYNRAESAFMAHDFEGAKSLYLAAIEECPTHPTWWLYAGDVWFNTGDVETAIEYYGKALAIAPCYWNAHRFMSDALWKRQGEGDAAAALDHAIAAVACNPTYEIGWSSLSDYQNANGHALYRPIPDKPGDTIDITGGPETMQEIGLWGGWAKRHAAPLPNESALDTERAAIREALSLVPDVANQTYVTENLAVWPLLAKADAAGQLDAAIFVLMMDERLIGEFEAWRDSHPGETDAFIRANLLR